MATGRDDFVIAIRSAFLKKKDKSKVRKIKKKRKLRIIKIKSYLQRKYGT